MQAFGDFFCRIEKNSIYFVRMDSGYACIRRYLFAQNRKPLGSAKKIPALVYIPQNAKVFSVGPYYFYNREDRSTTLPIPNYQLSTLKIFACRK